MAEYDLYQCTSPDCGNECWGPAGQVTLKPCPNCAWGEMKKVVFAPRGAEGTAPVAGVLDHALMEQLEQAVIAQPADDAARLAYWRGLAATGGDLVRADLIELQMEMGDFNSVRRVAVSRIVQMLLAQRGAMWAQEALGHLFDEVDGVLWRRGFIERVELTGKVLVEHGKEIARRVPLRGVHITALGGAAMVDVVSTLADLSNVVRIEMPGLGLRDTDAVMLASQPFMARVEYLDLCDNWLGDQGVRSLIESPFLRQARVVDLYGNPSQLVPRMGGREGKTVMDVYWPPELNLMSELPQWLLDYVNMD